MTDEEYGIKETKEVIEGAMTLICLIVENLKDGYQSDDIVRVVDQLKTDRTFLAALEGIASTPKEMQDIDLSEGLELGWMAVKFVPRLIAAARA